ncbi:hypothetical protein P7K49_040376, partial [Saguinus oedipus]
RGCACLAGLAGICILINTLSSGHRTAGLQSQHAPGSRTVRITEGRGRAVHSSLYFWGVVVTGLWDYNPSQHLARGHFASLEKEVG